MKSKIQKHLVFVHDKWNEHTLHLQQQLNGIEGAIFDKVSIITLDELVKNDSNKIIKAYVPIASEENIKEIIAPSIMKTQTLPIIVMLLFKKTPKEWILTKEEIIVAKNHIDSVMEHLKNF